MLMVNWILHLTILPLNMIPSSKIFFHRSPPRAWRSGDRLCWWPTSGREAARARWIPMCLNQIYFYAPWLKFGTSVQSSAQNKSPRGACNLSIFRARSGTLRSNMSDLDIFLRSYASEMYIVTRAFVTNVVHSTWFSFICLDVICVTDKNIPPTVVCPSCLDDYRSLFSCRMPLQSWHCPVFAAFCPSVPPIGPISSSGVWRLSCWVGFIRGVLSSCQSCSR